MLQLNNKTNVTFLVKMEADVYLFYLILAKHRFREDNIDFGHNNDEIFTVSLNTPSSGIK